jgi:hypothetical protein
MTDKEKILAKIELLINETNYEPYTDEIFSRINTLKELKSYIDSLQEEPVSEEQVKESTKTQHITEMCKNSGDSLTQEPVSDELEEAINAYIGYAPDIDECSSEYGKRQAFKAGAKWQKKQDQETIELAEDHAMLAGMEKMKEEMMKNIWKPADGDDLPEYDREVIVLINYDAQLNIHDEEYPTYRVGFGHRPNPNGWDGKNIDTNEVAHYTPKTYDKGGWNIPDVKYWLDVELPKEIEL